VAAYTPMITAGEKRRSRMGRRRKFVQIYVWTLTGLRQ